ncbi:MAG TPA: oligosaccharide flippase family protein [Acidobacteriota bacterium]|nr:oligosaccharide flippase family protein [Acidobacteriota bacterium]
MRSVSALLKRDEFLAVSAAILGFAADYLLNVALSRMLQAHEFGDFRVAQAFAFFCASLVLLGGDRAAPRMLAKPLDRAEFGVAWEYLRFYGLVGLGFSVLIIGVVWWSGYLYHDSWHIGTHHAVAIMALAIPLMAAGALAGRILQTVGRTFQAAMPWKVGAPLLFLLALLLVQLATGQVGLHAVLWLACLTIAVIALAQWALVRHNALKRVEFASGLRAGREWLVVSIPMMGVFLVTVGLAQSDLFFLEWFGVEREVGHYAAAVTTAHFIILIQVSIVAVYAPLVARDIRSDSSVATGAALSKGHRVIALALAPVVLAFVVGAVPIMNVFGTEFQNAAPALRWLAIGNGVWAMAALSALWLQYQKRGLTVMRITIATLVVDSLLNVALIPSYGMLGAAASSAATSAGSAALLIWIARRPSTSFRRS